MSMYKDLRIELSAVCLYGLYGKLNTLLHLYHYNELFITYTMFIFTLQLNSEGF